MGQPPYAGIVSRGCAIAGDVAIVQAAVAVTGAVVALIVEAFGDLSSDIDVKHVLAGALVWGFVFSIYLIGFWSLAGQTPGMRLMGIHLATTDGLRLRPKRGLVRIAGMVLAAIPLFAGYLPILVNERRQGLHDKLARSVVRYR